MILRNFSPAASVEGKFSLAVKSALSARLKASTDAGFSHCNFGSCNNAAPKWMMHLCSLLFPVAASAPLPPDLSFLWMAASWAHHNSWKPVRTGEEAWADSSMDGRVSKPGPQGLRYALTARQRFGLGSHLPWRVQIFAEEGRKHGQTMVRHTPIHQHRQHTVYLYSVNKEQTCCSPAGYLRPW